MSEPTELTLAYLGLGSNLNNPTQQLTTAIQLIDTNHALDIKQVSSFYPNKALLHPDFADEHQPDFINAVISVYTQLTAFELLTVCQRIENQMGRVRHHRPWTARVIDIDILLFGDAVISTASLCIPHPQLSKRPFVVKPLLEIAPDLVLPN